MFSVLHTLRNLGSVFRLLLGFRYTVGKLTLFWVLEWGKPCLWFIFPQILLKLSLGVHTRYSYSAFAHIFMHPPLLFSKTVWGLTSFSGPQSLVLGLFYPTTLFSGLDLNFLLGSCALTQFTLDRIFSYNLGSIGVHTQSTLGLPSTVLTEVNRFRLSYSRQPIWPYFTNRARGLGSLISLS